MSASLITIGLTCYNARSTIERALESALLQNWENFEVVVVDDCSTDGSVAAIESVSDHRVRLFHQVANKGAGAARNRIISEARGDFICFFDDDDESLPGRLSSQYAEIERYEAETGAEIVACYASGQRIYDNGHCMTLAAIGSKRGQIPVGPQLADYLLFFSKRPNWFYGAGVPTCSMMARKSVFALVGEFDSDLRRSEDIDFAIRMALVGGHFIGTAQPQFVQHATSAPDKSPRRNLEAELRVIEKHADYLKSRGRYFYAWNWPQLRYYHFVRRYDKLALTFAKLLLRHPIAVTRHILDTGPRRLMHERQISKPKS